MNMKPPRGAKCQEASPLSGAVYLPCGAPAGAVVKNRDAEAYYMCDGCADHNVRNRGARYAQEGESIKIYEGAASCPAT